jgi:hypothetical protein
MHRGNRDIRKLAFFDAEGIGLHDGSPV